MEGNPAMTKMDHDDYHALALENAARVVTEIVRTFTEVSGRDWMGESLITLIYESIAMMGDEDDPRTLPARLDEARSTTAAIAAELVDDDA
jgi:hypothetical protein